MKVAISGKGGTGKTTLAGVMARVLGARGFSVLAIDADPDSNLASAVGITSEEMAQVKPLAQMKEFIEERTGATKGSYGSFFTINPRVDDIPEAHSIRKDGVRLVLLGSIPQGGGGCFCPESALLRSLLAHVFIERDEVVIVDMEAGLEHLGRGTTAYMDALIVTVEPGLRSFQTAREIERLAGEIGVKRVFVVGNKVRDEGERDLIRAHLGTLSLLGFLPYSEGIINADKEGRSPFETDPATVKAVEEIVDHLAREVT
jgi:CO dehydrogenase maturation factor